MIKALEAHGIVTDIVIRRATNARATDFHNRDQGVIERKKGGDLAAIAAIKLKITEKR